MATYAITGSSGYVGTRMVRWLLERDPDTRVIGFDIRPPPVESDRLEFHRLDVRDRRIGAVLQGRGVCSLLHFAFVLDPLYDEAEMSDIDLGGTQNVLDAAVAAGVPHVVATSSTTAYGAFPDNPFPLTEDSPTRAAQGFHYAYDKRLMDEMLRRFEAEHPALRVCVIRPCIVLGPNVSNYIASTMLAQPVVALLDGRDPPLQFVHEDDLVRLIALCVERQAQGTYNAVGGGTLTGREAAELQGKRVLRVPYAAAYGMVWALHRAKVLDFSMPPGVLEFFRYPWIASGEKARRELGFEPQYSARECFEIIRSRKDAVLSGFRAQMRERGKR